jgi:hypothetical protein
MRLPLVPLAAGQRAIFGLVVVFGLGAAAPALQAYTDVQVFAVGANTSFKKGLEPLKFAESDAQRFVEAMKTVGLVPQPRAAALTNPSVAEFREAIQVLIKSQAAETGDDSQSRKFIFYFSGHSDDRGLHLRDGMITKSELHDELSAVRAHTKIAILDSCFSGAISAKGVEPAPEFELPKVEFDEPSGSVFLSASTGRQFAYESDALEGSIFTHHLLSGLYGDADGNADGVVTVDELYQYVYRNTKWQSLNYPSRSAQEPEYVAELQGQGAIILSFPAKTNSKLILAKDLEGEITVAAAKGLQYFKIDKTPGQAKTVQLPVGAYKLSLRDGQRVGEGAVKLEPLKIASLGVADFSWREADVEAEKVAKGDVAAINAERDYGFMVGVHSSYFEKPEYGPFVQFDTVKEFYANGHAQLLWGLAANYHRHVVEEESYKLTAESLGLFVSLEPRFRLGSGGALSYIGLYMALGEMGCTESYNGSSMDKAYAPAQAYGLEFGFSAPRGNRIALTLREERVDIADISGGRRGEAVGRLVGLKTVF